MKKEIKAPSTVPTLRPKAPFTAAWVLIPIPTVNVSKVKSNLLMIVPQSIDFSPFPLSKAARSAVETSSNAFLPWSSKPAILKKP